MQALTRRREYMFKSIYHFLFSKPFEFRSPHTLADCEHILTDEHVLDRQPRWYRANRRPYIRSQFVGKRCIGFNLSYTEGTSGTGARIFGEIEKTEQGVLVHGKAVVNRIVVFSVIFMMLLAMRSVMSNQPTGILFVIVSILLTLSAIQTRNKLYNSICDLFGKKKNR